MKKTIGFIALVIFALTGCSTGSSPKTNSIQNDNTSIVTLANAPVPVSISSASENLKVAQAVQAYLERVSDPNVFEKITILNVTDEGMNFGKEQWTVKLDIQHQTNRASAYNQGVNYQYIMYTDNNNQLTVTGLATGMPTENNSQTNPLFITMLTLPDGQIVKPDPPSSVVHWKNLTLSLLVTSLPPANSGLNGYFGIVGNHATIISHQRVFTALGSAMLIYFQRTQPAAAQSNAVTNEYYVIFYGSQYAYVLDVIFNGNIDTAKSEIMGLLPYWKLPR
ncbi:hypothetical protein D2Q93_09225 [Alicyclobacillaceae bacterium I2511]|nr:hypothetical protein D2Q93_09225 [Alicyclobacillaceae bacterium I2511]